MLCQLLSRDLYFGLESEIVVNGIEICYSAHR